jgi:hypothetical protein
MEKHLPFLEGFLQAWNYSMIHYDRQDIWVDGASAIFQAYCEMHSLPLLSCDELIAQIKND